MGVAFVLRLLVPAAARADDAGSLEKALSAYVAHRYEDAEARLRALLDPVKGTLTDPYDVADARMYLGAVLVAQGKKDEANKTFEALLLSKPDYQPDPLRVSLEAIDAFIDTRTRLHDQLIKIEADVMQKEREQRNKDEAMRQKWLQRQALLEKFASEEVVVRENSRWVALLPFGVGQFQNGQDGAGWAFLATESMLAIYSVAAQVLSVYSRQQANDALARRDGTATDYESRANTEAIAGDCLAVGFYAWAVAGIVHAQLTYVPAKTVVRRRALPQLSLRPIVGPEGVGILGRF